MGKLWLAVICLILVLSIRALSVRTGAVDPFSVYRIGSPELSAADVLADKYRPQETPSHGQAFTPSPGNSGWWRVELHAGVEKIPRPMLYLESLNITDAEVWRKGDEAPLRISQRDGFQRTGYSPRRIVVALEQPLQPGDSVYWRILTHETSSIRVGLKNEYDLRKLDMRQSRYFTLIEGALLALVFSGVVLSIAMREWSLLSLTAGMLFSFFFVMADNGDIYHYAFFAEMNPEVSLQYFFGVAVVLFFAYFSYDFLDMPRSAPILAVLQRILMAFVFSLWVANFIPGIKNSTFLPLFANISAILIAINSIIASLILIKKGCRSGHLYLLSWMPLILLLIMRVIEITFKLPFNDWENLLYFVSFVLAGVLLFLGIGERVLIYKRQSDANHILARMDVLTDVYNRRALDERLQIVASQNIRNKSKLALLFLDVDCFKAVNDRFGHVFGDEILKKITHSIRETLRFGDVLGRYGGEEFVVALPNTSAECAHDIAERIRANVANQKIYFEAELVPITVSIGISILKSTDEHVDVALKRADAALYVSKENGRNRVHMSN